MTAQIVRVEPDLEGLPATEPHVQIADQALDERIDPADRGRPHRLVVDPRVADEKVVVVVHGTRQPQRWLRPRTHCYRFSRWAKRECKILRHVVKLKISIIGAHWAGHHGSTRMPVCSMMRE